MPQPGPSQTAGPAPSPTRAPTPRLSALLAILGLGLVLIGVLPALGGHAVQLAIQVLVLWCFGLSYQLLFGRTGMLSFGHAVSFGLAAFGTAHAVRALGGLPVAELMPLVGAVIGALCGLVLGYPVTRRSGIAFAMVTLGLGELVAACFLMFPGFFGGEAGVTLQRTRVHSMLGLDYGLAVSQLGLTAVWAMAVLRVVRGLSHTPFGLATLAVRENAQRVEYLGFRTATVRWVSMIVASTLAGVAGSLAALADEIVTVDAVSLHLSANVLLMTVIGGLGSLWGPLVGAGFLTAMQSVVSDWTRAWLFYYGFVFVVLVWLAPEGITGLWRTLRRRRPALRQVAFALLFALLGVVFVETAYQLALGEPTRLPGWQHLGQGALKGVAWASGLAVVALLASGLRRANGNQDSA